jgi:uncharacterized protein (TIGR02722 family)
MKKGVVFFSRNFCRKVFPVVTMLFFALLYTACASTSVKRVDAEKVTDLSGYWNDTDVRIVCDSLIKSCLDDPGIIREAKKLGRNPVFLVGRFRNESDEHIDTSIIADTMRVAIRRSGRADFVTGGAGRDAVREERQDQQGNASEATASKLGNETGADFLLEGSVKTIIDTSGNTSIRTYRVTAELANIETGIVLWDDQNSEIKKVIKTSSTRL